MVLLALGLHLRGGHSGLSLAVPPRRGPGPSPTPPTDARGRCCLWWTLLPVLARLSHPRSWSQKLPWCVPAPAPSCSELSPGKTPGNDGAEHARMHLEWRLVIHGAVCPAIHRDVELEAMASRDLAKKTGGDSDLASSHPHLVLFSNVPNGQWAGNGLEASGSLGPGEEESGRPEAVGSRGWRTETRGGG